MNFSKFWNQKIGVLVVVLLLVLFLLATSWPVRKLLSPKFLTDQPLILLTNEAEARPCGGFLTAFGELKFLPPSVSFQNVYALSDLSFGAAPLPLREISSELKFWDLGTSTDLEKCAQTFRENFPGNVDRAILVDFQSVEKLVALVEPVGDFTSENLFSKLSRTVANVDRHDETSLAERKSPIADFGKKLAKKLALRPWLWPRATKILATEIEHGNIFVEGISSSEKIEPTDFAVIEWNLGGAKSSRFLEKNLTISLRETTRGRWNIRGKLTIEHLGGWDEPISQMWRGGFELRLPKILGQEPRFFPMEIAPGQNKTQVFDFSYNGDPLKKFGIFRPRSQKLSADVHVSVFPQQVLKSNILKTHENVGTFSGDLEKMRHEFSWDAAPDVTEPFVVLHEWLKMENLPDSARQKWAENFLISSRRFSVAEIHFNEPIAINSDAEILMHDKNFENPEITNDPVVADGILLENQRTLLLGFWQENVQPNERFSLQFSGIQDLSGNKISNQAYTIIDRTNAQ
ncbi:hypothetical protein HN713_00380 [bacterium]|nr:hypothetical protein [bacterium]